MSCDQFDKFELGNIGEKEFKEHLKECSACQEQVEQEERLMSLVKSLKKPIEAPGLWTRIERTLSEEQQRTEGSWVRKIRWRPIPLIPVAAITFIAICVLLYIWLQPGFGESKLLAQGALEKVEKKEGEYIKAIIDLEKTVLPKMEEFDMELSLLYKDKLETINSQIELCKEALYENPANAHIRRYLLAALQDKKQTLDEIMISHEQMLR
jgi:hypothetical protein